MNKNDCCFKIAGPTQAVIGPWTGGLEARVTHGLHAQVSYSPGQRAK